MRCSDDDSPYPRSGKCKCLLSRSVSCTREVNLVYSFEYVYPIFCSSFPNYAGLHPCLFCKTEIAPG